MADGEAAGLREQTIERLRSDVAKGLASDEARLRRQQHGPNELGHRAVGEADAAGVVGRFWQQYGEGIG